MSDSATNAPVSNPSPLVGDECNSSGACFQGDSAVDHQQHHSPVTSHRPGNDPAVPTDGAGEPCPAPLMWQEICENYYRDSIPWEISCGAHRITGRTWGQGTPLYFINNFAATAEMYALVAWLLRDEYRCVLFDVTTRDRKAARQKKAGMPEFARDLFAVADAQGDAEFAVYGAGFGAAVALQAMLDSPQRIPAAVLQHGLARRRLTMFEKLLAAVCQMSDRPLDHLPQRRRFQAVNHQPWFPPFDQSRFDFLLETTGQLPLRDLARRALAVNSFDVLDRLREIEGPVLLLRTEGEGKLAADSQNELEQGLHQAHVEWMHSAGQHPCLTHPHRVAKLLRAFLGRIAESKRTLA